MLKGTFITVIVESLFIGLAGLTVLACCSCWFCLLFLVYTELILSNSMSLNIFLAMPHPITSKILMSPFGDTKL